MAAEATDAGNWSSTNHKGYRELTVVNKVVDQLRFFADKHFKDFDDIENPKKRVQRRWTCAQKWLRRNEEHLWGDIVHLSPKLEVLFLLRAALNYDADKVVYNDLVPDSIVFSQERGNHLDLSWCGATYLDLEAILTCVRSPFPFKSIDIRGWVFWYTAADQPEVAHKCVLNCLEALSETFPSLETILMDPALIIFAEKNLWSKRKLIKDRDQDGTLYDEFQRNDEERCSPDVYEWVSDVLSHSKTSWMFRAREHEPRRAEKDVDGDLVIQLAEELDGMPYSSTRATLQHHVCLLLTRLSCPAWRKAEAEADAAPDAGLPPKNELMDWLDATFYYAGDPPRTRASVMVREALGRGVTMRMIQRILHAWCEHYVVTIVKRTMLVWGGPPMAGVPATPYTWAKEIEPKFFPCEAGVALQPNLSAICLQAAKAEAYTMLLLSEAHGGPDRSLPWERDLARAQQQQSGGDKRTNKKKAKEKKRAEKQCMGLAVGRAEADRWEEARNRAEGFYGDSHIEEAPEPAMMCVWWRYAWIHVIAPLRDPSLGGIPRRK
jgi:hypothetical protein